MTPRVEARARGMRPKRSLGQNFLTNAGIARKMAELACIGPGDTVVEVGPGRGMLTRCLLSSAGRVLAVEKDDGLVDHLRHVFSGEDRLVLVHGDILECDLHELVPQGAKIVANLPYNIASRFVLRLTEAAGAIDRAVLMLQKEVADRLCAKPSDTAYSALTVIVSASFSTSPGFTVGPANFFPRPKVDSRVVVLTPRSPAGDMPDPGIFARVVRSAFSRRRKVLANTLVHLEGMDARSLSSIAGACSVDLRSRPQDVSVDAYLSFCREYEAFLGQGRTLHR